MGGLGGGVIEKAKQRRSVVGKKNETAQEVKNSGEEIKANAAMG